MPMYDFKCEISECNHIIEELFPMSDCPSYILCSECGNRAYRIISSGSRKHAESSEMWSKAFGINPDQITEMKRRFPDDEYHPVTGAMKIKGYQHQQKVAKRLGMIID